MDVDSTFVLRKTRARVAWACGYPGWSLTKLKCYCDISQRDVDPADGAYRDGAAFVAETGLIHRLPQPLDLRRVLADQHRLQAANFGDHALGMILQIRLSQARQTLVGVNPQPNPTGWNLGDLKLCDFHVPSQARMIRM